MEIIYPGKPLFDDAVKQFKEANFLQSWLWGEANRHEHTVERFVVQKEDGQFSASVQIIIKNAKRGKYAEIAGGPLLDWADNEAVDTTFTELRRVAREHGCVFIRVRPQIEEGAQATALLNAQNAVRAPMHLHAEHTNIIDISKKEDDLLAAMRRQTRYEVRKSFKQGLSVVSSVSDVSFVDRFVQLQAETAKRQGFIPPKGEEIYHIFEAFGDRARIYEVWHNTTLLNMALVVSTGEEADYLEAASSPDARQFSGAYGLLWQAIVDARNAGLKRFNLWGIAYSNSPHHRYASVTTFKRGFGGRDVTYVPAHDIILRRIRYKVDWIIETIRKKRRGL